MSCVLAHVLWHVSWHVLWHVSWHVLWHVLLVGRQEEAILRTMPQRARAPPPLLPSCPRALVPSSLPRLHTCTYLFYWTLG